MNWEYFSKTSEISDTKFLIKEINNRSYGVIKIDGEYHALWNVCPHEGAEICRGKVSGTTLPSDVGEFQFGLENKVISCPWHGWEFDVRDGKPLFQTKKQIKVMKAQVKQDEGNIFLYL